MAAIHWLNEAGDVDREPVCSVDFDDDGMAIDFAHNLYGSVHAFGRSKPGFAIKSDGRRIYAWRWDNGPTGATDPATADEADVPVAARELEGLAPSGLANSPLRAEPPGRSRVVRQADAIPTALAVAKVRRWRPEIDHYLLAIIIVLAVLCGSPLCSIYATVQNLLSDGTFLRQDRSNVALATRNATRTALATDGKLDFRKLFWHLRVVGPTEIHLLAYEPKDGQGPRLVFQTSDLIRWHLQSVRGADGTWWARSEPARSIAPV